MAFELVAGRGTERSPGHFIGLLDRNFKDLRVTVPDEPLGYRPDAPAVYASWFDEVWYAA